MPGCQPRSPQGAQCVELRLKPQLVANQSLHLIRTRRTRPRPDASGRRTALFGAWLEPRPRGLGVSSCGSSRSSKRAWSVPGYEDEEEGDDGAAAQQTHRFVRGVAGATPQGLGVSSCGSSRSSKRAWSVPGYEDEEEGDDGAAAQQTHRFVRGVAGATPQGDRCVELRQKPQLEAAARSQLAAPVSAHQQLPSTGRGRH